MMFDNYKPFLTAFVLLFIAVFVAFVSVNYSVPTANAVVNISGNISVVVNESISIILIDSVIDFGNCTLNQSRGYSFFDSFKVNTSFTGCDNYMCTDIYQGLSDYIEIENDGNVDINVTLKTNVTAGNLYKNQASATNSYYQYRGDNNGLGCSWTTGNLPFNYVNMTVANNEYQLCDNMSYNDSSGDSFEIYAGIWINATANSGGQATWTFTAIMI